MKNQRRKFTSAFKSKVVIEAISEQHSLNKIAEKFEIDSNLISEWKKIFLEKAHLVFDLEDYTLTKNKSIGDRKRKATKQKEVTPLSILKN